MNTIEYLQTGDKIPYAGELPDVLVKGKKRNNILTQVKEHWVTNDKGEEVPTYWGYNPTSKQYEQLYKLTGDTDMENSIFSTYDNRHTFNVPKATEARKAHEQWVKNGGAAGDFDKVMLGTLGLGLAPIALPEAATGIWAASQTPAGQTLLAGTLGGEAWEALNHGITGQSWGNNLGDVIGLDKNNYLGRTALGLTNPFYFTSPNMIYKGGEAIMNAGKTALNLAKPQITIENVANATPEINKTVINNSQKIPALSLEEIQRAFDQAKQWHLNRINSSGYRNKALRAGFTEEEIPLLQKQLIDQLNRLKLLSPKDAFGPNVKLKINNNSKGPTSAGYWTTLINGKLRQGVELSHPNMSYDDAVSNFIHELGHGATFGLNGTETSGYMKALADQFPLINRLVKYNRTLYPEISARRIELAVPGATRTGNINYYASPSEMLSRGYEFIRDYGINWTKANRAGKLSSTTHKDLVGNRRNSNIFNTIATPKGAINFLKNALGISIPIGIGYDLYNNLSQNEIR